MFELGITNVKNVQACVERVCCALIIFFIFYIFQIQMKSHAKLLSEAAFTTWVEI